MNIQTPVITLFGKIYFTADCTIPFTQDWLWWSIDKESRGTGIESRVYHLFAVNYVERTDKICGLELFFLPFNVIIAWNK